MQRKVAILLESSISISREHLEGIVEYMRLHERWQLDVLSGGLSDQRLSPAWRGDGIIARIPSSDEAARIANRHLPTVLIDPQECFRRRGAPLSSCPSVANDTLADGRLAAEHLLPFHFTTYAYVAPALSSAMQFRNDGTWPEEPIWSRRRLAGFQEVLEAHGETVRVYPAPEMATVSRDWNRERPLLMEWLRSLPRPAAVYVAHDPRARQVADACLTADLGVPYQIAILGTNDDRLVCETAATPLSSVRVNAHKIGYVAAERLHALMRGERPPRDTAIPPLGITVRASTSPFRTNDRLVIAVLEAIRLARGFKLRVSDLAERFGVTARWLEKRFAAEVGRSVSEIIRETLLDNVRLLVAETDTPFQTIAAEAGHLSASHLTAMFRARYGHTMTQCRAGQTRHSAW